MTEPREQIKEFFRVMWEHFYHWFNEHIGIPITICSFCGRMAITRQCFTCLRLMCDECYQEHQGMCLKKKGDK